MRKYLRNTMVVALCVMASNAPALAADPVPYNPFTLAPVVPGQQPVDWKPVPESKPVAPPPSMEANKAYQHAKTYSECVESVMPTKNRSPVDLEAASLPFTAQMRAAINACLNQKGVTPDPMAGEDSAATEKDAAEEATYDASSYARDRAERAEKTRELIKKQGLEKYLAPEGSKGTAPIAPPVAVAVTPPPVVPLVAAKKTDSVTEPEKAATPYVPTTTGQPVRGQSVFVPSKDDGPTPVFLP